jgi:glycosyltransferase involved in cell wall biosynthesis
LRFLWVGDGLLRNRFAARIRAMGLEDRFVLSGLVKPEQVPELMAAMDIVAHPSRREGLARALAQGSLAGKPVIGYDIDGNREGVLHEKTGLILPPFDRSALQEAIDRLARDGDLRQRMGQAGREFALGRFDANVMVDALEKLYQQGS